MERKWYTLISCCLSCFMAWLDFNIVNIALPDIQRELGASLLELQWVINAYLLSLIVLIVTLGRLSDWLGRKIVHIVGVASFGVLSFFCGWASSADSLIFWRMLQGMAASAIVPTSLALISHAFPGKEKGKAIGIWSAVTGIAMAAGPVLGGFLVTSLSWRWIFYINIPLSLISVLAIVRYATESKGAEGGAQKIDLKGFCLLTISLTCLIFSLMHAPDWGWVSLNTLGLFGIAVLSFLWFYRSEKNSPFPIIPFAIFQNSSFLSASLVMFGLVFSFTSDLFLIPLYLIQVRGMAPDVAGLLILPLTAAISIISPFAGYLMQRFQSNHLMNIGLSIFCISTLMQAFIHANTSFAFILMAYVLFGIGWGIARPPATTTAIASASHHFAATATGVLWSVQNIGGAISIALTITIFRTIFEEGSNPLSFVNGYHTAMWILSAVSFGALLISSLSFRKSSQSL